MAWYGGEFFSQFFTNSGVCLYLSPSITPGIPHDRKYSKFLLSSGLNPAYLLPPGHPIVSLLKRNGVPFLTVFRDAMRQLPVFLGLFSLMVFLSV